MKLYSLQVPKDDAWSVMNTIGEIGYSQFIDLNRDDGPHSLPFTKQVKQCEEAERKLSYLQEQCRRHLVKTSPPDNVDGFVNHLNRIKEIKKKAIHLLLDEIMKDINKEEKFAQEQSMRLRESEVALQNVRDCYHVLRVAQKMIPQLNQHVRGDMEQGSGNMDQKPLIDNKLISIERVAGVVESEEVVRFRKLIFRATKGKSFMYTEQFTDSDHPENKARVVYIITYYDGAHIRDKIQRICDSFSGQRFNLPE